MSALESDMRVLVASVRTAGEVAKLAAQVRCHLTQKTRGYTAENDIAGVFHVSALFPYVPVPSMFKPESNHLNPITP